jgi:maltooligosyltrehalose trehalohydrolase
MEPDDWGNHSAIVERLAPDSLYSYELSDGRSLPDPASRFQPKGVHGPSQIADLAAFEWSDNGWKGRDLASSIFYELHVGTFTEEGTFESIIPRLDDLAELGITTIELMPIAQFPGTRNWGYDGVYEFAAQNTYGGPRGLQRLVDAAHNRGLAVALDVVYNHLGPEGNYLGAYGPYFSARYRTPWGEAINFDGPDSDPVRRYFIDNALYWAEHFHIDALRLDAIHGIFDFSAYHFLAQLKDEMGTLAERLGRPIPVIAESNLNDSKLLHSREQGGYGLDGEWADDFHHAVHTLLTGEHDGYYADFGKLSDLAKTLKLGWCYTGQYSVFRRRRQGNSPAGIDRSRFVVCTQNHDQVGNRALGERLTTLVGTDALKLAAGITLLSPLTPLLFMGEEYAEAAPFLYFVSHSDADLIENVRKGRRSEFSTFEWAGEIPDPQAESTFDASRLDHSRKQFEPHRTMLRFYKRLICFRREYLSGPGGNWEIREFDDRVIGAALTRGPSALSFLYNFAGQAANVDFGQPGERWQLGLDSSDSEWLGPGSAIPKVLHSNSPSAITLQPWSFAVFERVAEG